MKNGRYEEWALLGKGSLTDEFASCFQRQTKVRGFFCSTYTGASPSTSSDIFALAVSSVLSTTSHHEITRASIMIEGLDAVLDDIQLPHQPWVIITDSSTFSGLPLLRELLRRSLARYVDNWSASYILTIELRGAPALMLSVLYPPSTLLPKGYDSKSISLIDLTNDVPGFSSSHTSNALRDRILSTRELLRTFISGDDLMCFQSMHLARAHKSSSTPSMSSRRTTPLSSWSSSSGPSSPRSAPPNACLILLT